MVFLKLFPLQSQPRTIKNLLNKNLTNKDYLEYQFIQHSQIPTLHFQSALPRLPIPDLNKTCERYLAAQKPLLIEESYKKTEANVNRFKSGVGKQLQKLLKDYDKQNKHTSYISELWFDKYLKGRDSLPINSNPVLVFNKSDNQGSQLIQATNLIISSMRFYKSLKANLLYPEIYHLNPSKSDTEKVKNIMAKLPPKLAYIYAYFNKAFPLDMSQYPNLFNSTRIPETDKDRILEYPNSKHVTVQYKGHFYVFDVLTADGDIVSESEILTNLKFILDDTIETNKAPIGIFTSLNRDKWATIRHDLIDCGNKSNLKLIDSALFNVCLDDINAGEDPCHVIHQFLHSDGTNRWFDKSFSLIIAKDGVPAVNFEHAWGDGVAVLRYSQDMYKDSSTNPRVSLDTKTKENDKLTAKRLDIKITPKIEAYIDEAKTVFKSKWEKLDVNYTIFEGIGKETCKVNKVSPDAIMQLAFQVAYHKLTGKFVPTYESCSTAAFRHGRTEAIRPCTSATKAFTLAINSKNDPSVSEMKSMIQECSTIHNQLIKEAAMGQGFDRHLFALKSFGEKNGLKSNIFDDPEYAHIGYDIMSTSTLNSPAIFAGGFGPVVPDGYGIGYVIKENFLGTLVTNYKDRTNGPDFVGALKESFEGIFKILQTK